MLNWIDLDNFMSLAFIIIIVIITRTIVYYIENTNTTTTNNSGDTEVENEEESSVVTVEVSEESEETPINGVYVQINKANLQSLLYSAEKFKNFRQTMGPICQNTKVVIDPELYDNVVDQIDNIPTILDK